jgi:hypothetical protein
MDEMKTIMEKEWEEHCRNLSNRVLVEMTQPHERKLAWMLSRLSSGQTVMLKARQTGRSHYQSRIMEALAEYMNAVKGDLKGGGEKRET